MRKYRRSLEKLVQSGTQCLGEGEKLWLMRFGLFFFASLKQNGERELRMVTNKVRNSKEILR